MDCRVRDFSATGARVHLTNTAIVPDQFDLTIARKERSFRARMVWRSSMRPGSLSWANTTKKSPCRWSWPGACDKAKLRKRSCETASPS
ncbi:MAG: PilZ domain-containing protein [Pseudolabrys sp.]